MTSRDAFRPKSIFVFTTEAERAKCHTYTHLQVHDALASSQAVTLVCVTRTARCHTTAARPLRDASQPSLSSPPPPAPRPGPPARQPPPAQPEGPVSHRRPPRLHSPLLGPRYPCGTGSGPPSAGGASGSVRSQELPVSLPSAGGGGRPPPGALTALPSAAAAEAALPRERLPPATSGAAPGRRAACRERKVGAVVRRHFRSER